MKNLQTEYVKDIENDVPDLWNRIEKGLDEIEKPAETPKKVIPFYSTKAFKITCESVGIAACLLIVVSVLLSTNTRGKSMDSEAPAYAPAASVAYEASEVYEEAESLYDEEPAYSVNGSGQKAEEVTDSASILADPSSAFFFRDREADIIELEDGTFQLDDYVYAYKYELSGSMGSASENEGVFTVLSNREDLTFTDCMNASAFGSDSTKYFNPEESVLVKFETRKYTK